MLDGYKLRWATVVSGLALTIGAIGVGLVPATPAQAKPDIDDVQKQVDTLYHQAEQASERLNDAQIELDSLKSDLASLRADQKRQDAQLTVVRHQVTDSIVSQYEGQSISAVGEVVVSDDPDAFLSGLSTMSAYSSYQDQLYDDFTTAAKALRLRAAATARREAEVAATEKRLAAEKKDIETKHGQAEALLDKLKAQEREAILSRNSVRLPSGIETSGKAATALGYAMAQVGKAYVYGAAGPNAFDCSGLVMMAWAQAGVALPHSSAAQYSSGQRIAESELRPGDLVFYYSPISHVGMYIGNGLIVNALNPGVGVVVSDLHSMPYSGAVRPG